MPAPRRVRPLFLVLLLAAVAWSSVAHLRRARAAGEVLGYTECPFRGEPRVVIRSDLAPEDTQPVRVHEAVHASQCRDLGPMRYRLRNLSGTGKLSLELPAYCAAANTRVRLGIRRDIVRARLLDDIQAAFAGLVDSAIVARRVSKDCPIIELRLAMQG